MPNVHAKSIPMASNAGCCGRVDVLHIISLISSSRYEINQFLRTRLICL